MPSIGQDPSNLRIWRYRVQAQLRHPLLLQVKPVQITQLALSPKPGHPDL